ncbi:MAG TPA: 5-dehydro-4-deoxy-D-glucuronate isomerase [Bacillota bacterium]|nr:5-dehydro-4-deoxy-D-glucuronate isomerase [Bacillota bacterium]
MEIRYASNPEDAKGYTTERIRSEFLIDQLFIPGQMKMVYSHLDRIIVGGVMPTQEGIKLDGVDTLKTDYFLQRREIGIVNIGSTGTVIVDGENYTVKTHDCLYIGLGKKEINFYSEDASQPAKFYLVSTTAHKEYPIQQIAISEINPKYLGENQSSNKRTLYQIIHENGIKSCQLMLGITRLDACNMWNTMPAHHHDRRTEVYLYFDLAEDARVFHLMGQPSDTRHIVVKSEQAVLSPSWSIHSGVGTSNYSFIWAMAGENYTFDDMDFVTFDEMK